MSVMDFLVDQTAVSSTLLSSLLPLVAILLTALFALFLGSIHLKRRLARRVVLRRPISPMGEKGAVVLADTILIAVLLITFITCVIQVLWLMRETLVVHSAAFAVARAEKAHSCPTIPAGPNAAILQFREILCTRGDEHREEAARFALISAAPPWNVDCLSACRVPESVVRAIAKGSKLPQQANTMVRQAQYAFDKQNVVVKVSTPALSTINALPNGFSSVPGLRAPIRVELIYRHYVLLWIGRLVGKRRSDGNYYWETRAVVEMA